MVQRIVSKISEHVWKYPLETITRNLQIET
jgi:hypothetical protein